MALRLRERFFIGKITAFAVCNGHAQQFVSRNFIRKRCVEVVGFQKDVFAVELQVAIADERAGQQAGFGKHLKAIANAENEAAIFGKLFHGLHHGTEPRNRTTAQIITVTETAGHNHSIRVT